MKQVDDAIKNFFLNAEAEVEEALKMIMSL